MNHVPVRVEALVTTCGPEASLPDGASVGAGRHGFRFWFVAVTFSAANSAFDFLAASQTLTITYEVTVTDKTGQLDPAGQRHDTGTNDAPVATITPRPTARPSRSA